MDSAVIAAATTHLSKPHVANLRDIFQILDEARRGAIHLRDLPVALNLGDLETTQAERTGLVAVHVADRDAGVTELEFLTICDVVASSRRALPEYSAPEQLRRAFDALASHEHGVVPTEGVLKWGEDVMRACDECLLLEHGFEYDPSQLLLGHASGAAGQKRKPNQNKNTHGFIHLEDIPSFDNNNNDDDDDEDENDHGNRHNSNKNKKNKTTSSSNGGKQRKEQGLREKSENDEFIAQQLERRKKEQLKQEREDAEVLDGNSTLPLRTKLRRRSSSAMLVPRDDDDDDDDDDDVENDNDNDGRNRKSSIHSKSVTGSSSPTKNLSLPEVAARQKLTGNPFGSFSDRTIGGKTLLSHHADATQVFGNEDVEGTTQWLLQFLGGRYALASEAEKREIEMLMELARAAGHHVESVSGVLTRDAFVKFVREMRGEDYDDEAV